MIFPRIYCFITALLVSSSASCTMTTKTYTDYAPDLLFVRSIRRIQTRHFKDTGTYLGCSEVVSQALLEVPLPKYRAQVEIEPKGLRGDTSHIIISSTARWFCVDCRGKICPKE